MKSRERQEAPSVGRPIGVPLGIDLQPPRLAHGAAAGLCHSARPNVSVGIAHGPALRRNHRRIVAAWALRRRRMPTRAMKFFTSRPVRCACTAAALASALGAMAQEAPRDLQRFPEAAARPFSIIDLGAASPNQRPRLALRMRFDSATRAM